LPFHKRHQFFDPHAQRNAFRGDAVIRVYDAADDVIATHEHKGDFKEPWSFSSRRASVSW
jgi:hypothetical protein